VDRVGRASEQVGCASAVLGGELLFGFEAGVVEEGEFFVGGG
jgi:hypothetical protein